MFSAPAAIRRGGAIELIIPSGEDFIFEDWLVGQGILAGNIVATLPAGNTIGGTMDGGYAFRLGDITAYSNITLNIEGSILGRGGDPNGGDGSHGLYSAYPIDLNITGAIKGGGGGGGAGGDGARGTDFINPVEHYSTTGIALNFWIQTNPDGSYACVDVTDPSAGIDYISYVVNASGSADIHLGYPCQYLAITSNNQTFAVWRGSFRERIIIPGGGYEATNLYSIYKADFAHGVTTPGDGGKGQGYEGPLEQGEIGTSIYRAGKGGNGGDGGAWGAKGDDGLSGGSGTTYTTHGSTHNLSDAYKRASLNVTTTDFSSGFPGGNGGVSLNVPLTSTINDK